MQTKKTSPNMNGTMLGLGAAAVVGAGLAVTAAAVLKDENNRKKIGKAVTNVKNKAGEYLDNLDAKMQSAKDQASASAKELSKDAKNLAENATRRAQNAADKAADKVKERKESLKA